MKTREEVAAEMTEIYEDIGLSYGGRYRLDRLRDEYCKAAIIEMVTNLKEKEE